MAATIVLAVLLSIGVAFMVYAFAALCRESRAGRPRIVGILHEPEQCESWSLGPQMLGEHAEPARVLGIVDGRAARRIAQER
jgi:hypothetical protein